MLDGLLLLSCLKVVVLCCVVRGSSSLAGLVSSIPALSAALQRYGHLMELIRNSRFFYSRLPHEKKLRGVTNSEATFKDSKHTNNSY